MRSYRPLELGDAPLPNEPTGNAQRSRSRRAPSRAPSRPRLPGTPDPWVTACPDCGGHDFDLRPSPRGPYGLARYCVPCNGEAVRERDDVCAFDGCERPRHSRYCHGHAKQYLRHGPRGMTALRAHRGKRVAS